MLAVVLLALVVVVRPGLGQQPAAPSAPGHPAVPAPLGTIPQLGTASLDPTRPAVPAAKIRAVKILADWSVIEPQRGQTSWSHLDRLVATAVRERAAPVVVLAHTPRWASIGSGADLTRSDVYLRQPPRDVQDWERFVTAVAERYRGRVSEWQVWPQLGLPQFRGTGSEYVALLRAARGRLIAVDPRARVAMATPSGIDLSFVLRVAQSAPGAFDAVSLTPRGVEPESLLRPLSVLAVRLKPLGKAIWLDWGVDPSRRGDHASGLWARVFGVAQAAGVERVFAEDVGTPVLQAAEVTLRQPFTGYLVRDPDVFALVLGTGTGAVLLAWASVEGRTLDVPDADRVARLDGGPATVEQRERRALVRLDTVPVVATALPEALVDEARSTASTPGPLTPVVAPERDFSRAAAVFARLGRQNDERGLYNLPYRTRPNGAVEPVEQAGVEAVRTSAARQVIYVYFDLDDTFAYYLEGRTPLEVTVEVWGARTGRQLGFNLLYDSTGGYRFTPWQWVDVRDGWMAYTVRLSDATMANTWGWDFAINTAGNRSEDLVVRAVTVRKVAP